MLLFLSTLVVFAIVAEVAPVHELKKSPELAAHEITFTKAPNTAVSPNAMRKREIQLGDTKPGESGFIGDASYPVTEPPKDSVTPLGVEKNTWLPDFLGLGE